MTTLPGIVTTIISTLPGQVTTLPGIVTTVTAAGTTVISTLPGQVTTLPGQVTTLPGQVTTVPGQITTLPGSVTTSLITVTLPGSIQTITAAGTTLYSTLPGVVSISTTTLTLPPVTVTGAPGRTITVTQAIACAKPSQTTTVAHPQATGKNALWGCAPGYVCSPPKPDDCTIYADPPDFSYVCDPANCIPSPDYNDTHWETGKTGYFPPPANYFNLNPNAFGLDYGIFAEQVAVTTITTVKHGYTKTILSTYTTGDWTSQAGLTHYGAATTTTVTASPTPIAKWKLRNILPWNREADIPKRGSPEEAYAWRRAISKRDTSIVPAICYATCNNCFIEGQKIGLQDSLCDPNSAFEVDYAACYQCVAANVDNVKLTSQVYIDNEFAPFLSFCAPVSALSEVDTTSVQTVTEQPVPITTNVIVATANVPAPFTPIVSVAVTAQQSANTNTVPAPASSASSTPPASDTGGASPTSTSGGAGAGGTATAGTGAGGTGAGSTGTGGTATGTGGAGGNGAASTSARSSASPTTGGTSSPTQSGPTQVTNMAVSTRPVSFALLASILLTSIFALFL